MELPWSLASSAEWATESATAVMGSLGAALVVVLGLVLAEAEAEAEEGFRRVMVGGRGRGRGRGRTERVSEEQQGAEGREQSRAAQREQARDSRPPVQRTPAAPRIRQRLPR